MPAINMARRHRYRLYLFSAAIFALSIYYFSDLKLSAAPNIGGDDNAWSHYGAAGLNHPEKIPMPTSTLPVVPEAFNEVTATRTTSSTFMIDSQPTDTSEERPAKQPLVDDEDLHPKAKLKPTPKPKVYWKPSKEHYPVPPEEMISLPTGPLKPLPKIQADFQEESRSEKSNRLRKQRMVKGLFEHAWSGYKTYAMSHDELKPLTNGTHDPFGGWGATLVDSLDSLWIMDMKDDFEEAVALVAKIDFKTSNTKEIPLFETTIRYLGGLIAAYDISGRKYFILLDKAVELADILLGAFDTPNRMPIPFYKWAPTYVAQPRRSSNNIVLAELGSLAVEFTRLAQLTKEDRYYDVIARVTNALEQWQMKSSYPGIWPVRIDASGCKKSAFGAKPLILPEKDFENDLQKIKKRQPVNQALDQSECDEEGLQSGPSHLSDVYSIGAMADSTYEYFPKQYALLGGRNEQYRDMYRDAMKVVRKDILYRPMTKENRDILFPAKIKITPATETLESETEVIYEGTHLGCFAGGMFALGSKVFGIPSDMNIAAKLTDGCVWAYESTQSGIMPEEFTLTPCDSKTDCVWNETKWHEHLDRHEQERYDVVDKYNENQRLLWDQTRPSQLQAAAPKENVEPRDPEEAIKPSKTLDKRFVEDSLTSTTDEFIPRVALSHEKYVAARIQEERLPPGYTDIQSREYILRPEAIESVFLMYRITGDDVWREKGWRMFTSVAIATRTSVGAAAVRDVTSQLNEKRDSMESFWLAETLKYYYLLFSEPELMSLDEYIFNTEAHPFKLPKS